jgi:hypothetical protein
MSNPSLLDPLFAGLKKQTHLRLALGHLPVFGKRPSSVRTVDAVDKPRTRRQRKRKEEEDAINDADSQADHGLWDDLFPRETYQQHQCREDCDHSNMQQIVADTLKRLHEEYADLLKGDMIWLDPNQLADHLLIIFVFADDEEEDDCDDSDQWIPYRMEMFSLEVESHAVPDPPPPCSRCKIAASCVKCTDCYPGKQLAPFLYFCKHTRSHNSWPVRWYCSLCQMRPAATWLLPFP